ncbi:putative bifunctional diguanylate cyclase/phosphodiesterase [Colwellia psychrerythraea]|uniref:GGDEF/EAL domain protein n=1 Tax=Colwellia psychrerythraea (strain 34H / ATCC BAA-681) TaxID=167879 RepID=Q487R4_COLP3|nr:EAL domain-containing protein [Colwellia psychrerythraea]AAZ25273.1 GGDEF/EAL domain protein [Colwellia psychrerythraea 34H]
MNIKFVGVPTKLLVLIVSTLLLLAVGFSSLSYWRLQADYQEFQQNNIVQGQVQVNLHNSILRTKITVWLESFTDLIQLSQQDDFSNLALQLEKQYDALQLHLNVEDIWLVDEKQNILFATNDFPAVVQDNIAQVFRLQEPEHRIYCPQSCQLLLSLPLLNKQGDMVVVTMSTSLVDMLFALKTTLDRDVAVIRIPANGEINSSSAKVISASNMRLTESLLAMNKPDSALNQVLAQGLHLDLEKNSYLINLLTLSEQDKQGFYLALIDDVTAYKAKNDAYQKRFILSLSLIFSLLAAFVYFISSPFTKRLLLLSNALPLLAQKKFDQFRQVDLKRPRMFADELDVLAHSSEELSFELEQLNLVVEQKTKELENIAMYDLLTGLPNRNMLNYQLRKSLANIARHKSGVAVLFLDLDDFKKVNDSNGHNIGDKLLIQAAERVRVSVGELDLASRFGGDEFVIVLSHLNSVDDAIEVAEKVLLQFKESIKLGSNIFYVSTSIGIAYTESATEKSDDLISHADIAMYEAKDNGGGQYHIYHQEMFQRVAHRVMLEGEVRQALAKQQFSLSLQPQICAKTKKLYGFEALLRWQHPERGMISPEDFIPILENSQHMIELGYWIIRRCFELVISIKEYGLENIRIAINLSAGQFMDANLPHFLNDLLVEFSLTAKNFELELTEQTLVKDMDHTIAMMESLKVIGFSFAIDDFGTGYSSLAYLKKMPVDVIKIDKSFIFGMLENHSDFQIITSTIAMVKNLGLTVVAEGVETQAQLRSLTENDCDIIQGYYYSKPIPEKDLFTMLDKQTTKGYWKVAKKIEPDLSTGKSA